MSHISSVAARLLKLTADCRPDMHEPDEQGFKRVDMVGTHLDNAFGETIRHDAIEGGWQEYVIVIDREPAEGRQRDRQAFNLADLLALARVGALKMLEGAK